MKLTEASNSIDPVWNQDLDDLLGILGLDNCGNTHSPSYQTDNAVFALDESDRPSPALQPPFDEDLNFCQELSTLQKSSRLERKAQYQSTCTPGILLEYNPPCIPGVQVQSNSSAFPANKRLQIGQNDLDYGTTVVTSQNVTDNTIQLISTHNTSYNMDCTVFGTESCSFGANRSNGDHAGKLQPEFHDREETGNSSSVQGKSKSRIQSSSKLFEILSLILQAFECPLTTELEERYVSALQRALVEIQNARCY